MSDRTHHVGGDTARMPAGKENMGDPIQAYVRDVSWREPPVLARLRAETAALPRAVMQVTPLQAQLMALLVQAIRARRCLEIGTFTGYSSLAVALALPADGEIVTCDVSEEWTAIARRYWAEAGVAGKISLRLAPALATLDALLARGAAGTFDFAFIDADKTSYDAYYERALKLVRPGGLIAIDNVLRRGKVADDRIQDDDTRAIRALNRKLHRDERISLSVLTIGDGLSLACKRDGIAEQR